MTRHRSAIRPTGADELRAVIRQSVGLLWTVFGFSVLVNALMLVGPLYMMLVYDRVLGARSEETLVALTLLMTFLFLMMGMLDHLRGRIMARVGARFQSALEGRVFTAHLKRTALSPREADGRNPLRDVEAGQKLLASPVFIALFDIPWTPLFIAAIFLFHPALGLLATLGGLTLIGLALLNLAMTRSPIANATLAAARSELTAHRLASDAELVQSLGMRAAAFARWIRTRRVALSQSIAFSDTSGLFTTTSKTLRLFLQSAILGLGAWLVLQNQVSAGAMVASSILMGRALAPVETIIGQWQMVNAARKGRTSVIALLDEIPPDAPRTPLPVPRALLVAENMTILPPQASQAALRTLSFTLEPGQALGVIGPSGAGKTSLAKAVTGAWPPAGGKLRLDSATLDQYDPDVLGRYIGYLPQAVTLFDGTIAENIARLQDGADPADIITAARKADAHDMILRQPLGYDTPVSTVGGNLSGGQIQRIGLARALFGDPILLVLDEPNSNLDNDGTLALNRVIQTMKASGRSVIIIAHRPAAIRECDTLLVIKDGMRQAFGPREEVLRKMVRNSDRIAQAAPHENGVA